jgi:hypothetical protein
MKFPITVYSAAILLAMFLPISAHKIYVGNDTISYASGVYATCITHEAIKNRDTVFFHGFKLVTTCVRACTDMSCDYTNGIAFDSSESSFVGFSNNVIWDTLKDYYGNRTIISSDTIWANSNRVPTDITPIPLITTYDYNNLTVASPMRSVELVSSGYFSNMGMCSFSCAPLANAKTIIYLRTRGDRTFKLQFQAISTTIDSATCSSQRTYYDLPESLYVQWAADSAGNGIFQPTTSVRPAQKRIQAALSQLVQVTNSCWCDILGRRAYPSKPGIFINPLLSHKILFYANSKGRLIP